MAIDLEMPFLPELPKVMTRQSVQLGAAQPNYAKRRPL